MGAKKLDLEAPSFRTEKTEAARRIGEYRIVRLVGEGGMGKVFEAEERLSGRRVALKVLRPELSRSEDARRLFMNEMSILSRIDHPNVVRCLSCAEVDGELLMALEFLEGKTLRELIAERAPLPWQEAVSIVRQIAAALSAAHGQPTPVIHRDLKPENVMLLEDGSLKVMDFGIAKVLQALGTSTTHSLGTLAYMSPEQLDAGPIDGRSDLYALGLVFYELLSGRPPFESASPRELLNMQCTQPAPPLPEPVRRVLPGGIASLIDELLEKSPDARPATAEDVMHELARYLPSAERESRTRAVRGKEPEPSEPKPAAEPKAVDTVLMIERAFAPREVSRRTAAVVLVAATLLAATGTYLVRRAASPDPSPGVSSVELGARP